MAIHLLKNKSEDLGFDSLDPYEVHLDRPHFLPILTYVETNLHVVHECLLNGTCCFEALIVTSQRALDVLRRVLESAGLENRSQLLKMPVYTVGPATAARLDALGFVHVYGRETGNGDVLSKQMLTEITTKTKFLFLAGEIHRPLIRDRLQKAGHDVDTVIVYKTEKISYKQDLCNCVKPNDWIVFFSPSGSDDACEFVAQCGYDIKVASIGPTTEAHLLSKGIKVHCTAKSPSAESLAQCLRDAA